MRDFNKNKIFNRRIDKTEEFPIYIRSLTVRKKFEKSNKELFLHNVVPRFKLNTHLRFNSVLFIFQRCSWICVSIFSLAVICTIVKIWKNNDKNEYQMKLDHEK